MQIYNHFRASQNQLLKIPTFGYFDNLKIYFNFVSAMVPEPDKVLWRLCRCF